MIVWVSFTSTDWPSAISDDRSGTVLGSLLDSKRCTKTLYTKIIEKKKIPRESFFERQKSGLYRDSSTTVRIAIFITVRVDWLVCGM